MECLAYAVQKFKEITKEASPSTGNDVQPWWNNAPNKTDKGVRALSISCWSNNNSSTKGHAIFVNKIVPGLNKYECFEANWDYNGNTRTMYWSGDEIKQLYSNSKKYLGCVYND